MRRWRQAFIRGIIPLVIMAGISWVMRAQGFDHFQVKSTFLTGLIIASVAAASVIYDIEHWPLKKRSLVHFLVMAATVLPCLLVSGWFPLHTIPDYLVVTGIFLLAGLLLWSVGYLIFGKFLAK